MNTSSRNAPQWTVVDLFSGAGRTSLGFRAQTAFEIIAAADAQVGKPSSGQGTLGCNDTYHHNIGIRPAQADLAGVSGQALPDVLGISASPTVLIACPPCTGFSRMLTANHRLDDPRNSLVTKVADFVAVLTPAIVIMENARELINGRFAEHHRVLTGKLRALGYRVRSAVHVPTRFGLPRSRERAVIVAVRKPLVPHDLLELWDRHRVRPAALNVRRALHGLAPVEAGDTDPADPMHTAPGFALASSARRVHAIPHDGGSWRDLLGSPATEDLLTPAMRRLVARGRLGSSPDIYGRMHWDRPAPTIKRECSHAGNGRYVHPDQNRLCTVREMALLQGFAVGFRFVGSVSNAYRHVGDAVPPLISWQLAKLCEWVLTGRRPPTAELVMPGTTLRADDITGDPADHDATPPSAFAHDPLAFRNLFGHRAAPVADTAAR